MKVLVISAHPDDEVLGCGATMAKYVKEGHNVGIFIIGDGITARYKESELNNLDVLEKVEKINKDAVEAAFRLGVNDIEIKKLNCGRFDKYPFLDIVNLIREKVRSFRPDVVFTQHYGDYNPDHKIVYDATLFACRPNIGEFYPKEIYCYEVLSSTERAFQNPHFIFCPSVFIDVKETIHEKLNAMSRYTSEINPYPHPRSLEAIEILAKKRGNEVGLEFAEAFQLIRSIK